MLSILIPIYNFNVVDLITDLNDQSIKCNIEFEIICFDDGSNSEFKKFNEPLKNMSNVIYREIEENIGRSKIRNQLAEASNFNNLLFLDCDSELSSKDFIKKYIIHIENYNIVYGGRTYQNFAPEKKEKFFRWFYGIKRESIATKNRKSHPYKSFMTNNFLIRKKAYLSIRLNEGIMGYGHEDTLFGIRLKENDVHIEHINNPVIHVGLEDFNEFMDKTHQGLSNILFISKVVDISGSVRIYNYLNRVKQFRLVSLVTYIYSLLKNTIDQNLRGNHPNLWFFDLYKIAYLIELEKVNESS